MPKRRIRTWLILAFTASLLVHASLLAIVGAAMNRHQDRLLANNADAPTIPVVLPVELDLGVDAPAPPSPVWVGFNEAEEQLAPKSVIEQAAFTDAPVAAAPAPETPAPSPPEDSRIAEQPAQQPNEPPPANTPNEQRTYATAMMISQLQQSLQEFKEHLAKSAQQNKAIDKSAENEQPSTTFQARGPQPSEMQPPVDPRQMPDQSLHDQPAKPEAAIAPRATSGSATGAQADKESDATSIIDVPPDQWKLGKPLAAHGLELKPRRPTIDLVTMLTAAPGNPLCQIKFARNGEPKAAAILRGSGDSRVDDAILASLYRWRASGKELDGLPNDQTVEVRIHMLLNRSRLE